MAEHSSLNDEIRELDADADIAREDDLPAARKKAMDYLARRDHGLAELKAKLAQAGFSRETAERAADQLAAEGLQSDTRYAESFVQARAGRGKGPMTIRAELGQRGLAGAVIDDALTAVGVDWYALARDVREKKFGAGQPDSFREKARQMRFLQYRGFDGDQIQRACGGDD